MERSLSFYTLQLEKARSSLRFISVNERNIRSKISWGPSKSGGQRPVPQLFQGPHDLVSVNLIKPCSGF